MTLTTAHKILIASAVAFFLFFTVHQARSYSASGDTQALVAALLSLAACVGLALYYQTIGSK